MDAFTAQAAAADTKLAEMKTAYEASPQRRIEVAQAELARLESDPFHANRVLTSVAAQMDVTRLKSQIAVAEADAAAAAAALAQAHPADLALAGTVPEGYMESGPGAWLRDQAAAVPDLREIGLGDVSIREVLTDHKFTADEHRDAAELKARYLRDPNFVALYLLNSPDEVRQMTVCNAILASEIAD
jgi:hypothetical protein